ncbi:MAG: hypothetical protein IJ416_05895 [Ruminiclostridium sp.]|nr:hypothetical protein [Ruminiclostridium sp.]
MTIDGVPVEEFGNIVVKRAYSGVGTSGLCTSSLTFSVPAPLTASIAAPVEITGVEGLPPFYIASRVPSGSVINVTCYDRMAFAAAELPSEDINTSDGLISIGSIVDIIVHTIGAIDRWGGLPDWLSLQYISVDSFTGLTCSEILERIAKAGAGIWQIQRFAAGDDISLSFVSFPSTSSSVQIEEHTALAIGADYEIKGINATDGEGNVYIRGDTSTEYNTLNISSEYITAEGATEIWDKVREEAVTAVQCDKCIMPAVLTAASSITFAQHPGTTYRINSITAHITRSGIFGTIACTPPSSDEIGMSGKLTRAVDNAVGYNRKTGIQRVTRYQGIITEVEA